MDAGWTDNVARMRALIAAHPGWTWTEAPRVGLDHVVTYPLNGWPERAAHNDLGKLATYMEAVAKSTISAAGARRQRHPGRPYGTCPECNADIDVAIARNRTGR